MSKPNEDLSALRESNEIHENMKNEK